MANKEWLKWMLENAQTPEAMGGRVGAQVYPGMSPAMPTPQEDMGTVGQGMQEAELQPSEGGNKWLKNFLKVLAPVAAGALMAHEARPPDAPHGGTIGSKPAMAQALQAMSTSLTQKKKAEDMIKDELAKQQHTKTMEGLKQAEVDIKAFLADLKGQEFLAKQPKTEVEIADITEKTRGRKVSTDILEETGYRPGSRGLNIRVGGAEPRPEAVENLNKKIADMLNGVGVNGVNFRSPNYGVFSDLQGATNEQELEIIYRQNAGTLPTSELNGGSKSNYLILYNYLKEWFRKRPADLPQVDITGELPEGAGELPPDNNDPFGLGF